MKYTKKNINKNIMGGLKSRMQGIQERISESEDRVIEDTQSEQQRENSLGKIRQPRILGACDTITKHLTFMSLDFWR